MWQRSRCGPSFFFILNFRVLKRNPKDFDHAILTPRHREAHKFERELSAYNLVACPFARSIKALEATDSNAADVFIFWLAIAASLRKLFDEDEAVTAIAPGCAASVTEIVNRRYKQFVDRSPTDIYFTAFFLHPSESHLFHHHCSLKMLIFQSMPVQVS